MADDSEHLPEYLDFHPADTPRGMLSYNTDDLTNYQKERLNEYKRNVIRENYTYLKSHPEIKALVQFLLKGILKARPQIKLTHFLGKFLTDNYEELLEIVDAVMLNPSEKSFVAKKTGSVSSKGRDQSGTASESSFTTQCVRDFCAEIIEQILFRVEMYESARLSDESDIIEISYS